MGDTVGSGDTRGIEGAAAAGSANHLNATVLGSAVQARTIRDVNFNFEAPPQTYVPHQLLPPPPHFTGRSGEVARLKRFLGDGHVPDSAKLVVITGVGGVGKTSLALFLLNEMRGRYPAGQLYADLGAYSPTGPVVPGEILGRFVRTLGVQPGNVPTDHNERAGLFRSLTDGRPIALLLYNAVSAAQARTLLPGPGPNLVVVTSRRRIAGLAMDGAQFTDLSPLGEQAAVELLGRVMGDDRAAAEPQAARSLVDMCGRLPLAVCASAARLAPRSHWSIGRMVDELANERRRLTALSVVEDMSVRAAFDLSYQALSPDAARVYRLLGLLPVADFGIGAAAATAALETIEAGDLLEILVETNLLGEIAEGRFRFHDLLRLHARDQAQGDPAEERLAAVTRGVDWYLRTATAADLLILPARWRLGPYYQDPPESTMDTAADAVTWLEAELPNLLTVLRWAKDNRRYELGWQLCEALWGLFAFRKHYDAWIESHLIGLRCAEECSDPRAEARMHIQLGGAYRSLRRFDQALDHFERALRLERAAGHRLGEGTALDQLGVVLLRQERYEEAIDRFEQSRAIHEEVGVVRGVALMNHNIGKTLGTIGRYDEALSHLEQAQRQFAGVPEPYHEAQTLTAIAEVRISTGRPAAAGQPLERADAILAELGATYDRANVQLRSADLAEALGSANETRVHLEQALALFTAVGAPQAEQTRARLEALEAPGPAEEPPRP
jgi:tetratricopeptide (TPR) repeat protein